MDTFSSLWWSNCYVRNQLVSVTSWPCCWESDDSEDYHRCLFLKMRKGNKHILKKSWWDQTWHIGDLQSYKQVAGLSQGPISGKMPCKKDANTPRVTPSPSPAVGTSFSFIAPSSEQHHWTSSLQGVSQALPRSVLVNSSGKNCHVMSFNVSEKETNQQTSFFLSLQIAPSSLAWYIQLNMWSGDHLYPLTLGQQ